MNQTLTLTAFSLFYFPFFSFALNACDSRFLDSQNFPTQAAF
jgi:hypothetical protein